MRALKGCLSFCAAHITDDSKRPKDSQRQNFFRDSRTLRAGPIVYRMTSKGRDMGMAVSARPDGSDLLRAAADSRAQFDQLLGELRPRLHRFCARMTGSVID